MVINIKNKILFIILLFISFNCKPKELETKSFIIAYCDMSKSIDEATKDLVIGNVQNLISKLPYNSIFYLYSINHSTGSSQLMEFSKEKKLDDFGSTPSELRNQEIKIDSSERKAKINIRNSLLSAYEKDNGGDNSCILNKFSRASDLFKSFGKGEFYIFIFSDMIEDCDKSILNMDISMEQNKSVESNLNVIENSWDNAPNLARLNVKPYIIYTSSPEELSSNSISYDQVRVLWNNIFKKLGYSDKHIEFIHFSPILPSSINPLKD